MGSSSNTFGTQASYKTDPGGWAAGKLGFGPGSSWSPQQQAQMDANAQNVNYDRAMRTINGIFSNPARTAQYSQLAHDTTQHYVDQLNQQKHVNDLHNKFMLADRGQTGGSQQAYDAQLSNQDYSKGLLAAAQRGQAAGSALQQADQQARSQLIAEAQSGLSATQAASQGNSLLQAALNNAQAGATAQGLGNMFGDTMGVYNQYLQQKAFQQASQNPLSYWTGG